VRGRWISCINSLCCPRLPPPARSPEIVTCYGWTPERRARQAELIRQWRPWEKATGPKTAAGKATVSRNADKGGAWRLLRELSRVLREQRRKLDELAEYDS